MLRDNETPEQWAERMRQRWAEYDRDKRRTAMAALALSESIEQARLNYENLAADYNRITASLMEE